MVLLAGVTCTVVVGVVVVATAWDCVALDTVDELADWRTDQGILIV